MNDRDLSEELLERLRQAAEERRPLRIQGSDTKRCLGRELASEPLPVAGHRGVLRYDPAELVVTARSGTPLEEIRELLAASGQRLPFEPPAFGPRATLGGTVACGLAGPARPWAGPLRDHLLGTRIITGDARLLRFGGEVIKNVAGYDVTRLMAGAFGSLGVLLEVSLKVIPLPIDSLTLAQESDQAQALARLGEWLGKPLPVTASAWHAGTLFVRLEGSPRGLERMKATLGGEVVNDPAQLWRSLREQTHEFFSRRGVLCRMNLPPATPPLPLAEEVLVEWHGMQRWVRTEDPDACRQAARAGGGFTTLFRDAPPGAEVFEPLDPGVRKLHESLKRVMDPLGLLNPGRMYEGL
jgi:glycolate oxidase FAD binding subunit